MTSDILTQSQLKEQLHYDPETGIFAWLVSNSNVVKAGDIAGCLNKMTGYIVIGINNKLYQSHRLAFLYMTGKFPENDTDHINHNRSDNRWANLREVTHHENLKNVSARSDYTSGFKGVSWGKRERKWRARIHNCGKEIYIGCFENLSDAVLSRLEAEAEHGYHNNHDH